MNEGDLMRSILLEYSDPRKGCLLFRNNVGTAWQGKVERAPGIVILHQPRPVHFGLHKGSADLLGIKSVTITPDMVGQTVGIFTSIETKGEKTSITEAQKNWANAIQRAGGRAGIARDAETAGRIICPADD